MGALQPIVPLRADQLGAGPGLIGLIVTMRCLMPFFLAIPVGRLTDVTGRKRVLQLGAAAMVSGGIAYAVSETLPPLAAAQIIEGIGELLFWTALQAIATDGCARHRGTVIGVFSVFVALGQFLGPFSGGLVADRLGYRWVFFLHIAVSASAAVMSLACLSEEGNNRRPARDIRWLAGFADAGLLLRRLPMQVALVGTFSMLFTIATWNSFYPLALRNHFGWSVASIGFLISVRSFSQIIIRPFMPALINSLGERSVLYAAMAMSTVGVSLTPLIGHSAVLLGVLAAVSGLGLGLNVPLTLLMVADASEEHRRGIGMSLRLLVNRLAQLLNPLLFGLLSEGWGLMTSFYVTGGIILLAGGGTMALLERRHPDGRARVQGPDMPGRCRSQ